MSLHTSNSTEDKSPSVFIHYSWDNEKHKEWVKNLADRLISDGVDVFFDMYDLKLGTNSNYFMENIEKADKIILITTPEYKKKADDRIGGVGYEYQMINSEISRNLSSNNKFITILRSGTKLSSIPTLLQPYLYLDMKEILIAESKYIELVKTIYNIPLFKKPAKGKKPSFVYDTGNNLKIDDIFNLGLKREEVHEILGEPQENYGIVEKYWTQGLDIYYDRHDDFVDGILVTRQKNGIYYSGEIQGIKIGEAFAEVKAKIGNPINWGLPNNTTSFAFYNDDDKFVNLAIWRTHPPEKYKDFKVGSIYAIGYCTQSSVIACEPIVALTIQQMKNNIPFTFFESNKEDYDFNFNSEYIHEEYYLTSIQPHVGGGYSISAVFQESKKIIDFWLYDLGWSQLVIRWISEREIISE